MSAQLAGAIAVLPIPFAPDEQVDEESLRSAVEFAVARKLGGICLPAYGSEFYKLSDAERARVVQVAIEQNRGRVPLVAQANHPSARVAADTARQYRAMGADLISFALPRQFPATEADLLDYCGAIAEAAACPLLLQDFNPGGATIDAPFLEKLSADHPNLSYVKLEEPLLIEKLARIRDRTGARLGLLSGWGGCYLLEGMHAGSCGCMPGLGVADLLQQVYALQLGGDAQRAAGLFAALLPYINFSLESFELFLRIEKRLLVRRGVFRSESCRRLTRSFSPVAIEYADVLIGRILRLLEHSAPPSTENA